MKTNSWVELLQYHMSGSSYFAATFAFQKSLNLIQLSQVMAHPWIDGKFGKPGDPNKRTG